MWLFSKKSELSDKILDKVKFLESEYAVTKARLDALETNISSLRNSVNRKGIKDIDEYSEIDKLKDEIKKFFGNY